MAILAQLKGDILGCAANSGLYMMRHVNDGVEERPFCGAVRGTEGGQSEIETLL